MNDPNETVEATMSVSAHNARILLVDDDPSTCELLASILRGEGHTVVWETRGESVLRRVAEQDFDVVLADVSMEGMDGIQLCTHIQSARSGLPVILITGYANLDAVVGGLRAGAYDFLQKPIAVESLLPVVARAIRQRGRVRGDGDVGLPFEGFIGDSDAMQAVFDLVSRVAESDASVLITGDSGTGKELVARSIHDRSGRRGADYVSLNCAAVPATLIESELFGHVRGAFTDASADRVGLFERANGGTLFLDEIGELPLDVQPKLLRALQERVVRPVGGTKDVCFDARILTATNRDLEARVADGTFRADLLYRIDVVRIPLPPLRVRGNDVLLLARHFAGKHATTGTPPAIARAAADKLLAYDWPGNVRELENCIERAIALARHDSIELADLPNKILDHRPAPPETTTRATAPALPTEVIPLDELKRGYVTRVLEMVGNNKTRAAKLLGLDRRSLYRRLED